MNPQLIRELVDLMPTDDEQFHADGSRLLRAIEAEKAAGIFGLEKLIDCYGIERVAQWMLNLLHGHGYTVVMTKPSPGTVSDPRR